jgi:hypothetical protein
MITNDYFFFKQLQTDYKQLFFALDNYKFITNKYKQI